MLNTTGDQDFLDTINYEFQNTFVPWLMESRGEYYVDYVDYIINSQGTQATASITINPFGNFTALKKIWLCATDQLSPLTARYVLEGVVGAPAPGQFQIGVTPEVTASNIVVAFNLLAAVYFDEVVASVNPIIPTQVVFTCAFPTTRGNGFNINSDDLNVYINGWEGGSESTLNGEFNFPKQALGLKVRDVFLSDSGGQTFTNLPQLNPDNIPSPFYGFGAYQSPQAAFQTGWYFRGDKLCLYPINFNSGGNSLRVLYFRRPNELVKKASGQRVTNILQFTSGGSTFYNMSVASNAVFSAVASTNKIDIISGDSPFSIRKKDVWAKCSGSTSLFVNSDDLGNIQVGDYVNFSGQSSFPNITSDLFQIFGQMVVVRVLEISGDQQKLQTAYAVLEKMKMDAVELFAPRSESEGMKIASLGSINNFV